MFKFILRWQGAKVWFYKPEDSSFYIVYDFSLGVGDTLYTYGSIPGIHAVVPLIIMDTSITQIGAKTLKVQHVIQLEPAIFNMYGALTEEIGWTNHLLPSPGFVDPPPGGALWCYVNNGFQYPQTGACRLVLSEKAPVAGRQVRVMPNPASGMVRVRTDTGTFPENLQMIDPNGRILATGQDGAIDVSHIPSGVYLLKSSWNERETTFSRLLRL